MWAATVSRRPLLIGLRPSLLPASSAAIQTPTRTRQCASYMHNANRRADSIVRMLCLTSAKEVMFSSSLVICLCVSRIRAYVKAILNRFSQNSVEMSRTRKKPLDVGGNPDHVTLVRVTVGRLKTQVLENASTEKASTDRKGGNRKYGKEKYKSQSWKTQVRCISLILVKTAVYI